MATRPLTLLFLCCLLSQLSIALQVTPNSPCASICLDSTTLDASDPNSSNTGKSDITCKDAQYGSSTAGIKWQNCMSCLQNSTFSQGNENDQMWFLYNMRYSLSYCIYGYPSADNASHAITSPCITSFACEPLTGPLQDGILSTNSDQYGYCSANNSAATHQVFTRCSSCIAAGGETQYLTNYLIALDAGCAQKPAPGHILGLNGSIFSPTTIGAVDPSLMTPSATPNPGSKGGPSSTIIAVIVVVIVVLLLVIAAFIFIRIKKRQNRRKRNLYETKSAGIWSDSSHTQQMPQSPLSFQCQTSPSFFPSSTEDEHEGGHTSNLSRKPSLWKPHNSTTSFQPISAITESSSPSPPPSSNPPFPSTRISIHQNPLQSHPSHSHSHSHTPGLPLHHINTSPMPSYPQPSHASPLSGSQARFSPDSYTPTSAISTRSNAPLLPTYVPAQHASTPSLRGPHNINVSSPVVGTAMTSNTAIFSGGGAATQGQGQRGDTTSSGGMLLGGGHNRDSGASTLPPAPPPKSPRMVGVGAAAGGGMNGMIGVAIEGVEGVVRFKARGQIKESGSPVESRRVRNVFPPPPPRRS
ncbi:hypothetical protein GE09DRAFT_1184861 [Coniochaeta sp. 2T2.1]|nr:hypothetical protein GE09DRAFT_1184861 [Coniochaeta sp. 2T2.1]